MPAKLLQSVQLFATPSNCRLLCPWNSPGKNTGVGCPCPPPGDLPNPGIKPRSLRSLALAGRFFTLAQPGKPQWAGGSAFLTSPGTIPMLLVLRPHFEWLGGEHRQGSHRDPCAPGLPWEALGGPDLRGLANQSRWVIK